MPIIPALRKLRLDYIKSIRSTWAIKYDHASKKKKVTTTNDGVI